MANNFIQTGNRYVSKAGNDANAGTSANSPKLTIASAISAATSGDIIVVGTGYYYENPTRTTKNLVFVADGIVVIDGNGGTLALGSSGSVNNDWTDFRFINFTSITYSVGTGAGNFTRCWFESSLNFSSTNTRTFASCVFIGSTITLSAGTTSQFNNCVFVNTTFSGNAISTFKDCITDSGTTVRMISTITTGNFNYNCIQGGILMPFASTVTTGVIQDVNSNYYDLSQSGSGGTGTVGNPFKRDNTLGAIFYLAAHKVAYPTYNVNSISTSPQFNNASKKDFTIAYTSPCYRTGSTGTNNIGAFEVALGRYAGTDITSGSATLTNISGTTDMTINTGGGTTAVIEEGWVAFSPAALRTLGIIRYVGALTYDKSVTPPVARNQNVPDKAVYTGADASGGGNPDRLIFELMWYTGSGTPTTNADGDNGGFATAGTWVLFKANTAPQFDIYGKSNADPAFNSASVLNIACTYFKIRWTLTNAYS
jgi:hypothetical protein